MTCPLRTAPLSPRLPPPGGAWPVRGSPGAFRMEFKTPQGSVVREGLYVGAPAKRPWACFPGKGCACSSSQNTSCLAQCAVTPLGSPLLRPQNEVMKLALESTLFITSSCFPLLLGCCLCCRWRLRCLVTPMVW